MTPGTSPRRPASPSAIRTAAAKGIRRALVRSRIWLPAAPIDNARLARAAALLYLAGLALVLTTAWHAPASAGGATAAGHPTWHLAFLLLTGAGMALLAMGRREPAEAADAGPAVPHAGASQLMAQLSHELRTPLNAVIGFSQVMLSELHGPLGNARYQEYAHHISESGGRLLKSSEEALAVTQAMAVLMTDRRRGRRERILAAGLVREAWRNAGAETAGAGPRLALTTCATCDILCERQPTAQALEHLLREAAGRAAPGGTVVVVGKRRGGRRALAVHVDGAGNPAAAPDGGAGEARPEASLRVILARLLLEVQGARLSCGEQGAGGWSALVEFPART